VSGLGGEFLTIATTTSDLLLIPSFLIGFLLLLYDSGRSPRFNAWLRSLSRSVSDRDDFEWITLLGIAGAVAVVLAIAVVIQYPAPNCSVPHIDDTGGMLQSGLNARSGANPFEVVACGTPTQVPYGLLAVGLNALGSFGGRFGIWLVWEAVAWTVVPLLWFLGGAERRFLTIFAATSPLYLLLVTTQIDGANNSLVTVTILLSLLALARWPNASGLLAGLFSTAKFTSLPPVLASDGSARRAGLWPFLSTVIVFAGLSGVSYAIWGSNFLDSVFFNQFQRGGWSLNAYGILLPTGFVTPYPGTLIFEVAILGGFLLYLLYRPGTAAWNVAVMLVVLALVIQWLSFNFLVWLLPILLLGRWTTRWMYAISIVGTVDYIVAVSYLGFDLGLWWPAQLLAGVMTLLLLGFLVVLLQRRVDPEGAGPGATGTSPTAAVN
jgi:hypothetical protein